MPRGHELFLVELRYADGRKDVGIATGASKEDVEAWAHSLAFATIETVVAREEAVAIDIIDNQFGGFAVFASELKCN